MSVHTSLIKYTLIFSNEYLKISHIALFIFKINKGCEPKRVVYFFIYVCVNRFLFFVARLEFCDNIPSMQIRSV